MHYKLLICLRDNSEEGEKLDPAGAARILLFVLSCTGKRSREGFDRHSEVGTVHSGQGGEGPFPLRKPKKSGKRENCEKDFVFR